MAVISWPTSVVPRKMEWKLVSNNRVFTSPFTGSTQVIEVPGTKWQLKITIPPLTQPQALSMKSFLTQLRGQVNSFRIYDYSNPQVVQDSENIVIELAAGEITSGNYFINFRGGTANTKILSAGEWIGIGDELKMVSSDVAADGNGKGKISLEPFVRGTYADGIAIKLIKPTSLMRLKKPEVMWSSDISLTTQTQIECEEAY